jgi:hypothetical protein
VELALRRTAAWMALLVVVPVLALAVQALTVQALTVQALTVQALTGPALTGPAEPPRAVRACPRLVVWLCPTAQPVQALSP